MDHKQLLVLAINRFSTSNGWLKFRVWQECGENASLEDCYAFYTRLNPRAVISVSGGIAGLLHQVEKEARLLQSYRIDIRVLGESNYPAMLTMIDDPPFVLYVRGELGSLNEPAFGLVGTRRPSASARRQGFEMGFDLAGTGCPVVSGMAYGVDGSVHEGAIEAGGRTWAVLAGGLDRPGPFGHRRIAEKILETGGALLGEAYPGYFPAKYAFHKRNRILSGLSRCVVVIQAPQKSGALLTAYFAIEQNRDLLVGSAGLEGVMSAGTCYLHEQGAAAVSNAADIFCEMNMQAGYQHTLLRQIGNPGSGVELANMMAGELNGSIHGYMGAWYAH